MKGIVCPGKNQVEIGGAFCFCETENEEWVRVCYKLGSGNIMHYILTKEEEDDLYFLLSLRQPMLPAGA